jgi:hypothetical protein
MLVLVGVSLLPVGAAGLFSSVALSVVTMGTFIVLT